MLLASEVTSRHWVAPTAIFGNSWPMSLRDGATPVPVTAPDDWQSAVKITVRGAEYIAAACCGPAAPLPAPLPRPRVIVLAGQLLRRADDPCGMPGPDGVRCERHSMHYIAAYAEDREHAATRDDELVTW